MASLLGSELVGFCHETMQVSELFPWEASVYGPGGLPEPQLYP